tara:strand:- start:294 stop:509 length:216 start_codon:yes stop_codon:yes gene_type:complete
MFRCGKVFIPDEYDPFITCPVDGCGHEALNRCNMLCHLKKWHKDLKSPNDLIKMKRKGRKRKNFKKDASTL